MRFKSMRLSSERVRAVAFLASFFTCRDITRYPSKMDATTQTRFQQSFESLKRGNVSLDVREIRAKIAA